MAKKSRSIRKAVKIAKLSRNLVRQNELRLDALKFGLAGGVISALCVFLITIGAVLGFPGLFILTFLIKGFYGFLGYNISYFGAIIGAVYGFIDGFILAYIFAWIYNKFL